jgi:BolA protein
MNVAADRLHCIRTRLEEAFQPSYLEVIDESHQHQGHAGYQGGGRHFAVMIAASCLQELSRIEAHKKIYALFADMMPEQIHALRISVIAMES